MDPGRITIAVAAAAVGIVVVILSGLIIAKIVENQRCKAQTRQAALVNEINIRRRDNSIIDPSHYDVPQPPVAAHRPRKLVRNNKTRTWETVSTEEISNPEMAAGPDYRLPDPLRSSMYAPPAQNAPAMQRDQTRVSPIKMPAKLRLSAITEYTDNSPQISPVSARANPVKQVSSAMVDSRSLYTGTSNQRYRFPDEDEEKVDDFNPTPIPVDLDKKHRRKGSRYTASPTSAAPLSPLPPLPTAEPGKLSQRRSQVSVGSAETVSSSVILGTSWPHKPSGTVFKQPDQVQATPQTDIDAEKDRTPTMFNYWSQQAALSDWQRNSVSAKRNSGGLQVIDASTWNLSSAGKSSAVRQMRWSLRSNEDIMSQHQRFSIASGPFSDEVDRVDVKTQSQSRDLESGTNPYFEKGHRRQSCVRISGLTPSHVHQWTKSPRRNSCISETIHEVAESFPSPKIHVYSQSQDTGTAHLPSRSPAGIASPDRSPFMGNANQNGTKANLRQWRGGSTLFGIFRNDPDLVLSRENGIVPPSPRSRPLEASSPGSIRMNSNPMQNNSENSKTAISDISKISHVPRNVQRATTQTVPKGPRRQPSTSSTNRKSSIKPASLRTKSVYSYTSRKTSQNDLRRSILMLKRMNSDLPLQTLKRNDSDYSITSPSEQPLMNRSPLHESTESIQMQPIQRKRSSTYAQPLPHMRHNSSRRRRRSRSASGMLDTAVRHSVLKRNGSAGSSTSMWEDASVTASPDTDSDRRLHVPQARVTSPTRKVSPSVRWSVFPPPSKHPGSGRSTPITTISRESSFNRNRESQYSVATPSPQQQAHALSSDDYDRPGTEYGEAAGSGAKGLGLRINDEPWEPGTPGQFRRE